MAGDAPPAEAASIRRFASAAALALRLWSVSSRPRDLTDAQWALLDPVPEPQRRKDGRPWRDRREALNGTLFILGTRAAWADLPERYPPYQTCHRRFQQWVRSGVMRGFLETVAEDLPLRGG